MAKTTTIRRLGEVRGAVDTEAQVRRALKNIKLDIALTEIEIADLATRGERCADMLDAMQQELAKLEAKRGALEVALLKLAVMA